MATPSQIAANRKNAQRSTGPTTDSGKARVGQNALKTGLFSKGCIIQPSQREDFELLRESLWESFAPRTAAEELLTNEIVRASWRMQCCAQWEATADKDTTDYDTFFKRLASIERARVQANGIMNRNIDQLRKLQTDRWAKTETLPDGFDISHTGIASPRPVISAALAHARGAREAAEAGAVAAMNRHLTLPFDIGTYRTKQTQSDELQSAAAGEAPAQAPEQNKAYGVRTAADVAAIPETKQTQSIAVIGSEIQPKPGASDSGTLDHTRKKAA